MVLVFDVGASVCFQWMDRIVGFNNTAERGAITVGFITFCFFTAAAYVIPSFVAS